MEKEGESGVHMGGRSYNPPATDGWGGSQVLLSGSWLSRVPARCSLPQGGQAGEQLSPHSPTPLPDLGMNPGVWVPSSTLPQAFQSPSLSWQRTQLFKLPAPPSYNPLQPPPHSQSWHPGNKTPASRAACRSPPPTLLCRLLVWGSQFWVYGGTCSVSSWLIWTCCSPGGAPSSAPSPLWAAILVVGGG